MRSPTRTLAASLAVAGLLLAACGSSGGSSSGTTAAGAGTTTAGGTVDCKPVKSGQLSVVTSLPGPNFWGTVKAETDPDTVKSGIEYDMANDIAKACGLKMTFRNENFDAIVAGQIAAGTYDLALSQVTITPERAKVVDFSEPYFSSDQSILVQKGTTVKTWDDVKKLKIGVQSSTTAEDFFLKDPKWKLDSDPQSFPDLNTAYEALASGQVQGVVIDTSINLGQAAQSDGKLEVPAQFKTGDEYGAIYPKGSDRKAIFDPIIKGLVDNGTVTALEKKYLGGDPSAVPYIQVGS